jgi:hypothetical protein
MRATFQLLLILIAGHFAIAFCQTNSLIFITSPAKMEWRDGWMYLRISDAKHSYEFPWGFPPRYSHTGIVSLESNRVYTFTVIEEESTLIPKHLMLTNIPIPRVLRIEDHGKLVWDHEVCEVHKTKMEFKEVSIVYGLIIPGPPAPTPDQELRLFPHRGEVSFGGCAVTLDSPKTESIYVCSECKEAFAWWSGTAKAPLSLLPLVTRYDRDPALRAAYLDSFGKGYVDAWAGKEHLPVFGPTTEEDKARVFGYSDGMVAGRAARATWSGAKGQRYGPTNSASPRP